MQKFLFSCFIITALVFLARGQNDSNITFTAKSETGNTNVAISSNSVKIVVKCRDTNSLLTVINLDNSGTVTMSNNEVKFLQTNRIFHYFVLYLFKQTGGNTMESSMVIMFDTRRSRTAGILSFFKLFSAITVSNSSSFNFPRISFFNNKFPFNVDNQTEVEQISGNETTQMI